MMTRCAPGGTVSISRKQAVTPPASGWFCMAEDQHDDVVIYRAGAAGGTLGHRLATNGVKVLWLERGPFRLVHCLVAGCLYVNVPGIKVARRWGAREKQHPRPGREVGGAVSRSGKRAARQGQGGHTAIPSLP